MQQKKVIALGFFDGVHLGHGKLLSECRNLADRLGCRAAAVTFSAHPDGLVSGKSPLLINTADDRTRLMKQLYRIDEVITLPFDRAMMTMPWRDFFNMLLEKYAAAGVVCGHDFRFGSHGEGTAALLQLACRQKGISCTVIPRQQLEGITVSSTYIRQLLENGEMERVNRFLAHPHMLTGPVVQGRHLGRTLGIPTANLRFPEELVCPRHGVYACEAEIEGCRYIAVTNVGNRPTVGGTHVTAEPWLLGFDGDLYGKQLTLRFYAFIRPERKFETLEALKGQIEEDKFRVEEYFRCKAG